MPTEFHVLRDPRPDEIIRDSDGNVIDGRYVSAAVDEVHRAVGRPPLGGSGESPQIRVRVPAALRDRAKSRAQADGVTLSELTREALEAYLAS